MPHRRRTEATPTFRLRTSGLLTQSCRKSASFTPDISNKKRAPEGALFYYWCAIICEYRTDYPQKHKELGVKIDKLFQI